MVRNIPNKYTQKMFLEEVRKAYASDLPTTNNSSFSITTMTTTTSGDGGGGEGGGQDFFQLIDFFYLPIDFKNKCNRGYAFINFLCPLSIPSFHLRHSSKKWVSFNSEKLCNISYARIQGRGAMERRFEGSLGLVGKEGGFRPVVFLEGRMVEFPAGEGDSSGGQQQAKQSKGQGGQSPQPADGGGKVEGGGEGETGK